MHFSLHKGHCLLAALHCAVFLGLAGLEPCIAAAAQDKVVVIYPSVSDPVQREFDNYYLALLKLALDKARVPYHMNAYPISPISESRSEYNLMSNRYNIHWLHTSTKREVDLLPIRIPLFKGLTGWRIFFIAKGDQPRFDGIKNVNQLQTLLAGQGHDWPDSQILRANQFRLETSTQWGSLFQMLSVRRFDYFPRSVIEIWREQNTFNHLNIEIEQALALQYPTAYYFFVAKQNYALANVIETGLTSAIADGSFDQVFYQYLGDYIRKARLDQRRVFSLFNPLSTFPQNPEYWFKADDLTLVHGKNGVMELSSPETQP